MNKNVIFVHFFVFFNDDLFGFLFFFWTQKFAHHLLIMIRKKIEDLKFFGMNVCVT